MPIPMHRVVLELNDLELAQLHTLTFDAPAAANATLVVKLLSALEGAAPLAGVALPECALLRRQAS